MQDYNTNIIEINKQNIHEAVQLVNEVFKEFVAIDYSQQGQTTFHEYLQHKDEELENEIASGAKKIWGYVIDEKIVGVASIRGKSHISLLFVHKNCHRKGIAKTLFEKIKHEVINNQCDKITVNSSPYAVKIYEKLGFHLIDERQEKNGIIFYPMEILFVS